MNIKFIHIKFVFIISFAILPSCSFAPSYQTPETAVSEQWKTPQENLVSLAAVQGWWEIFQDPELDKLVKQAIENNPNLMAAAERVEQSRDMAKMARSWLFPHLHLNPAYRKTSFLDTYPFGPNSTKPFTTRRHDWDYEYALPLHLTYEPDFWGKIRNSYASAKFTWEAQKEAYEAALLLLTSDLASAYYQLRVQDAKIELLEEIIASRKNALNIHQSRYAGEIQDYIDVASNEQDLDAAEADCFAAKEMRAVFENQIAALLGAIPTEFTLAKKPLSLDALPPKIPPGLPSSILLRRPDLLQQERLMASYNAQIGVAYASYFPSLFLTGDIGFRSPDWVNFLTEKSKYWLVAADVSQFIFDAGRRKYHVKLTWAQYREAADLYRQKVLTAFQEVEDTLSNLEWIAKGMESYRNAIRSAKTNLTIASDRFAVGMINYLDVTAKQRQAFENERFYLMLLGKCYVQTIQLIKALGGGWNDTGRLLEGSN